jgi:hypothetical protein
MICVYNFNQINNSNSVSHQHQYRKSQVPPFSNTRDMLQFRLLLPESRSEIETLHEEKRRIPNAF